MSGGLRTDLYELRMAASYLRRGMTEPATFSLFVRRLPHRRGFLVAAGLAEALDFLESFAFDDDELGYLREVVGLDPPALAALAGLRFTGDVRAVPEGRVVFADEPLLEVTAPIAEAQLVETGVLNLITFHTTVATKAARCRLAAGDAQLVDFAFRRTHGIEAGAGVARASAIAGFAATSHVEAARRYGLTPSGTMAHSYVEAFPDERAAFRAFAADFPANPIFLVDTYDTPAGVRAAVDVITELGLTGPMAVRLDSGDLAALARQARAILDEAGLRQARIVASGSLDEDVIAALVAQGAPIDGYGVGTKMGVSYDAPSLDSAYKLVAYGDRPVLKLSPGKATLPGPKQVFRDPAGAEGDLVGLRDEPPPADREPLLVPVMRGGRRLESGDPAGEVRAARRRFDADLAWLPEGARRLTDPTPLAVTVSPALTALHERVTAELGHGGTY
ncbi:nicotinate phosphoribosyltransferase [Micromonospora sp. DR5-3]|uniref:nicotinate phosphoribosyltransferase n=1 Tax=unclassified Micromonospora TaxID=2617518 RepID=UPI0011DB3071|nr:MULTISPECIES: nicotinate phosphoribosyltransferase [unclassified Micromonospora]MCW3816698.1 nicotinate phosphoribosyltransferase [Micromonospora sp. DR5-3]TYC22562.1 nicotinate phosphoribosyltransferase [Micromonospora sp. MP36]